MIIEWLLTALEIVLIGACVATCIWFVCEIVRDIGELLHELRRNKK